LHQSDRDESGGSHTSCHIGWVYITSWNKIKIKKRKSNNNIDQQQRQRNTTTTTNNKQQTTNNSNKQQSTNSNEAVAVAVVVVVGGGGARVTYLEEVEVEVPFCVDTSAIEKISFARRLKK